MDPNLITWMRNKLKRHDTDLADMALHGSVLSDTSFNAEWIVGTPTVDAGTDIITLTDHGLANGDAVEFYAGAGVLPAGILPYNSDTIGGTYYNVINVSGNTFQICATVGGTTPVDITSVGTNGWGIRKATTTLTVSQLNLDSHKEYDIFIFFRCAKLTTAANSFFIRFNNSANFKYFTGTSWGQSVMGVTPNITSKYGVGYIRLFVRKIDTNQAVLSGTYKGQESDNKSTATNDTLEFGSYILTDANIVSLVLNTNDGARAKIRNGTRAIVVRRA